ncbi:MAG: DUF805 domain-containing protein [Rhodobacteraceae bacterium]|nr:DUF805 domain-containing protein [Paracoccaceae bacterium]
MKNYATFSGCASRSEFWWFQLFCLLLLAALSQFLEPLYVIGQLLLFLPNLAAACRRLHDSGRSGWWLLLYLLPVIGWIVLLIFLIQGTRPEGNKFG